MTLNVRRSALYMPGANARAQEKARTLQCDVVIFDLEDATAADAKGDARRTVAGSLKAGGYGERELVVWSQATRNGGAFGATQSGTSCGSYGAPVAGLTG